MDEPHREALSSRRLALVALSFALVGAACLDYYHLGLFIPRMLQVRASIGLGNGYSFGDDFYPIWITSRAAHVDHADIYSAAMTRQIQTGLFGRPLDARNRFDPPTDYRQFAYPAFTDLLLWPAAWLDFPRLRLLLAVLLPLITAASLWIWLQAIDWKFSPLWFAVLVILTLSTYQLLEAFFAEQPGLLVGFFLASAALALRQNRLTLAGVLSSLTLIKPQMTLLAVAYLLLWSFSDKRRARYWQGFLVVTVALLLGSLWIWPHWIGQWVAILLGYHRYAMPPLLSILLGDNLQKYAAPAIAVVLLGLCAVLAWRNRSATADSVRFWLTLSLLLAVTSVALLPGQAIYDHVVLIPGILLVVRYRSKLRKAGRVSRGLLLAGALVLIWPWISAFALLVLRPWLSPALFYSTTVFALPIRTAASLPFAVLALLGWTWRISDWNSTVA
jgi:glycosyl transferase family 87